MSGTKLCYMGVRRLSKIAKHAVQVRYNTTKGLRIYTRSYAFYRGSEWVDFSVFDGNNMIDGKIYVNHGHHNNGSIGSIVRISLDLREEDPVFDTCKHFQVLNNSLPYDSNFAPVPFASDFFFSSDKIYHDDKYFCYDIQRKETANV